MSLLVRVLGQRAGALLAGAAAVGGFCASWLPETIYMDQYRDVVQYYENGFKKNVPDELQKQAEEVLSQIQYTKREKQKVTFFMTSSMTPTYLGTTISGYGVSIGLPLSFIYKSPDEVDTESISIIGREIDWIWPTGKLYKESFVLSDKAKRYAIAQQLYMADSSYMSVHALASCGTVLNVYILSRVFRTRIKSFPTVVRGIVHSLTALIGLIIYFNITDLSRCTSESIALDRATELGLDYCEGAIEYYQKALVKNKTLRILLKKEGAAMITPQGERKTIIRTKHVPLKDCLEKAKKNKLDLEE